MYRSDPAPPSLDSSISSVFIVGFVALFVMGCIPLPFASPPVRVSGTFGGGSSGLSAGTPASGQLRGRAVGRVGLSPLSFWKEQTHRVIDPEIGAVFEGLLGAPKGDAPDAGGYIGVAWRMWQERSGSGGQRLYLRGTGDFMQRNPEGMLGGGGSLSIGYEYTGFFSGPLGDNMNSLPAFIGGGYGEGGIGVELAGAGRSYGDVAIWQVTAGLTVRIPAVAGLLLLPIK